MTPPTPSPGAWRIALWGTALVLLLLPWVSMQFSAELRWDLGDFVVFGAMLLIAGGTLEGIVRLTADRRLRLGSAAAVALVFLLVWAELAVGIFD
jgi:hypothetical protein